MCAVVAPDLCEVSPLLSVTPPPLGQRTNASHPEKRAVSRTARRWHQPRVSPWSAWRDLHTGALCASHRDYMGRRCPTLLDPARCAGSGRAGWGGGGGRLPPMARRRPALVRPCPQHTRAALPRPSARAREGAGVETARRPGRPPAHYLSIPPPLLPCGTGRGGGAGRRRRP